MRHCIPSGSAEFGGVGCGTQPHPKSPLQEAGALAARPGRKTAKSCSLWRPTVNRLARTPSSPSLPLAGRRKNVLRFPQPVHFSRQALEAQPLIAPRMQPRQGDGAPEAWASGWVRRDFLALCWAGAVQPASGRVRRLPRQSPTTSSATGSTTSRRWRVGRADVVGQRLRRGCGTLCWEGVVRHASGGGRRQPGLIRGELNTAGGGVQMLLSPRCGLLDRRACFLNFCEGLAFRFDEARILTQFNSFSVDFRFPLTLETPRTSSCRPAYAGTPNENSRQVSWPIRE